MDDDVHTTANNSTDGNDARINQGEIWISSLKATINSHFFIKNIYLILLIVVKFFICLSA